MLKIDQDKIRGERETILRTLDIGDPAGESDRLLDDCRIETTAFNDILNNKKDIILGPKGAGKSSLYTIFSKYLKHYLSTHKDVIVLKGVASVGAPIYTDYWQDFDTFTDNDFQNFWNILFINILYRDFIKDPDTFDVTKVQEFEALCKKHGVLLGEEKEDKSLLQKTIEKIESFRIKGNADAQGVGGEVEVTVASNQGSKNSATRQTPARVKTRDILDYVIKYLEWTDKKIWIFLDQLDQAFERMSQTEQKALHGLITEALYFNNDRLKLKIFLRDDVFEFITQYKGIVNVDHLRISDSLRWDDIYLLKLILKRLLYNPIITSCTTGHNDDFSVDQLTKEECFELFYSLFPKVGSKGAEFWPYIMRELRDGNEYITPRDLILLIDYARASQLNLMAAGEGGVQLFSKKAIEDGLTKVSKQKISNYLMSEFPYLTKTVECFKNQWNKYDEKQLQAIMGKEQFKQRVDQLLSIGVLHLKKGSDIYWISPLYQRGLDVKNRKTSTKDKKS